VYKRQVLGSLPDQPSVAPGWLVGLKTPPVSPVVKGNRGINAQTVALRYHFQYLFLNQRLLGGLFVFYAPPIC